MSADSQTEVSHSPAPPPKKLEGNYTQINVLFPSSQVELPDAEKFKAFPPEAQRAILDAFKLEQMERHAWLKNQQANEHCLNMQSGRHNFRWRVVGTVCGMVVLLAALGFGSWLIKNGASGAGVFLLIVAVGTMIGSAIYGQSQKAPNAPQEKPEEDSAG